MEESARQSTVDQSAHRRGELVAQLSGTEELTTSGQNRLKQQKELICMFSLCHFCVPDSESTNECVDDLQYLN